MNNNGLIISDLFQIQISKHGFKYFLSSHIGSESQLNDSAYL
jgi:hypothetical protein